MFQITFLYFLSIFVKANCMSISFADLQRVSDVYGPICIWVTSKQVFA